MKIPHRILVLALEGFGILALLAFIAWIGLLARLAQGPISVDFLTRKIEKTLTRHNPGLEFSVGTTILTWGGSTQPIEFEMKDVEVRRADHTPILLIERVGVQFSKRNLAIGRLVPRIVRIYGPALQILRDSGGEFHLDVRKGGDEAGAQTGVGEDLTESWLAKISTGAPSLLASGLHEVLVTDAALLYKDDILGINLKSKQSDIVISRGRDSLTVTAGLSLETAENETVRVRAEFEYNRKTRIHIATLHFTDLNPARLSPAGKGLSDIDMPVKGSITIALDDRFMPGPGRFVLAAGEGHIRHATLYPKPLPLKNAFAKGSFDLATQEAVIEELRGDLDGPTFLATGGLKKNGNAKDLTVKAELANMPMDRLKAYWPESLTPDPRAWVTQRLSKGTVQKATLDLALVLPAGDFSSVKVNSVGGRIDFSGIRVDYFPPFPPVTDVHGYATYDHKSFAITATQGTLGDMRATSARVAITDLDIQDEDTNSQIDISVQLAGPLATALGILDSKPLEYPKNLGIISADAGGQAAVDVRFRFPLHKKLALPEVKVEAKAALSDVRLGNIVPNFMLSGGPIDLTLDNGAMTTRGQAYLDAMPLTFEWVRNFKTDDSRITAKLPLSAAALAQFGVPPDLKISGTLPAAVTYTTSKGGAASLALKGDLTATGFTLPVLNHTKAENTPGTLDMTLQIQQGRLSAIPTFALETEGLRLQGSLEFLSDGKTLKRAAFNPLKTGATDIALDLVNAGGTYNIRINGRQFDASALLTGDEKPGSDAEAAKPSVPLSLTMIVDRLITAKDAGIDRVRLNLRQNAWRRIEQMDMDGTAGNKRLSLRYAPVAQGRKTLRFEADNAGAALAALGITKGMRGGKILVLGQPTPNGGARDLQGTVAVSDFTLVNVPALGRLLNAMSLTGIVDLLNGKGIAFKKARADFQWVDNGQPQSYENTRLIRVKDGETAGASLGLTFQGNIDNWKSTFDLDGTIIPVSDLNKMLAAIPVVGDLLTGGGKGVFAATYTLKGPKADPTVTVNPLAALAPGVLRKLFFEK